MSSGSSGRKRGRGRDLRERKSRSVASATAAAAKKGKKAEEGRQSASADMMRNFVGMGSTAVGSAASSSSAASSASGAPALGAHDPAQMGACLPTLYEQEMEEAADDDAAGPSTVPADPPPPPPIVTLSPDSVLAELDNEDQVESMDGKESVMFIYLHAVVQQLKKECSTTGKAVPGDVEWLLPLLKEDGYWLRAHKARHICKKLGVTFTCEAYYTDVRVWVPQLEFGIEAIVRLVQVHGTGASARLVRGARARGAPRVRDAAALLHAHAAVHLHRVPGHHQRVPAALHVLRLGQGGAAEPAARIRAAVPGRAVAQVGHRQAGDGPDARAL